MPIPDFQTLMRPLLELLSDGADHSNQEQHPRLLISSTAPSMSAPSFFLAQAIAVYQSSCLGQVSSQTSRARGVSAIGRLSHYTKGQRGDASEESG
jgi:hypothetical protein